ncbi:MAG TPA: hypothetical protein VHA13_05230 [Gammaproteobacteria bacterium]|nr:hypothetical protein [Gammaproteobacteria bacterium]
MYGSCGANSKKCCAFVKKGFKFGMAFGVTNAVLLLALGWVGWLLGYGMSVIEQSAVIYHGYEASFVGGFVGAAWGFAFGFIYGYVFGVVLQFMNKDCCSSSCASSKDKK